MRRKLVNRMLPMHLAVLGACSAIGCSRSTRTFEDVVAEARRVAAAPPEVYGVEEFNVSVVGSDADTKSITFEIDNVFGHPSPSRATVALEFRAEAWRVQSMTTDWSEFGTSSLIAEQAIMNAICRRLDQEYVPPRPDPEDNAELHELIGRSLQLVEESEDSDERALEAQHPTNGDL